MKLNKYLFLKISLLVLFSADSYCNYKPSAFDDILKALNSENTKDNFNQNGILNNNNQIKVEDQKIAADLLKHAIRYQMSNRNEVALEEEQEEIDPISKENKIALDFKCPIPEVQRAPEDAEQTCGIGSKPPCQKDDLQCALVWAHLRRIYGPENKILSQGAVITFGTRNDEIEVFMKFELETANRLHGYISAKKERYEKLKNEILQENYASK